MKNILLFLFILFMSGCRNYTGRFDVRKIYPNHISLERFIGKGNKILTLDVYEHKALIFSISEKLSQDKGKISLIDLDANKVIFELKNDFYDYMNLILSMYKTTIYITERGAKLVNEYNYEQKSLKKVAFTDKINTIIAGSLTTDSGFYYFLNSPYGSTIISKSGKVYKDQCKGVVISSDYATISKPLSRKINIITTCLSSAEDSVEIVAVDQNLAKLWSRNVSYENGFSVYFSIFNVNDSFLIVNNNRIELLSTNGNIGWIYTDSNPIVQFVISGTDVFALSKQGADTSSIFLKRIDLKTGAVNDNVILKNTEAANVIPRLSISSQYAIVQIGSKVWLCDIAYLKKSIFKAVNEEFFLEPITDNVSGKNYVLIGNDIYW